ncbi:MAG: class I SAM-dependent methyltransferase [Patescibacteria group bacterium]|nr:class I SAM-dependent methyltransferase [Patescibacteria group bacterium]
MDNSYKAVNVYNKISKAYADEFNEPSEYLDEFLELLPRNASILDVGCGVGIDSKYATSKGCNVVGVDLSEKMLETAKSNYPQIDFRLEDIRHLKFEDKKFDGVIASCSLIHIPKVDVPKTLENFSRMLSDDGVMYIGLQSGQSEELFIDEPFKPDEKLFLNIIASDEIESLLNDIGFKILKRHERKAEKKEELDFTKLNVIAQRIK